MRPTPVAKLTNRSKPGVYRLTKSLKVWKLARNVTRDGPNKMFGRLHTARADCIPFRALIPRGAVVVIPYPRLDSDIVKGRTNRITILKTRKSDRSGDILGNPYYNTDMVPRIGRQQKVRWLDHYLESTCAIGLHFCFTRSDADALW